MWVIREIIRHLKEADPVDEYCRATHGFDRMREPEPKPLWRHRLAVLFSLIG